MTRKKLLVALPLCLLVVVMMISILACEKANANPKTDAEKMREMADRVEDAILSVDGGYEKQIEIMTFPMTYSDAEGNTIVFTQSHTKYYEADPTEISGLHIESIEAVVALPENYRECTVVDMSAAWFEKEDRAFLCWTMSPEVSCVIEYSPESLAEDEVFKMAESVAPYEPEK